MNAELVSRTTTGEWAVLLGREEALEPDAAFALLVARQSRFVFKVAYAVLRNVEDAEDVVQETFLKLFRTRAWTEIQDERRFLAKMAWRLAIGRIPSKRRMDEIVSKEIACDQVNPEKEAIVTERSRMIHSLIDALPEKLRRPLALSSIQEMTTSEIAIVMGLPEGTVRRRIVEARALVKAKVLRLEGGSHG